MAATTENHMDKRERAVAFMVVRLSSSRFPEKQFQRIGSQCIIDWVLKRLRAATELDGIVIATVSEPANLPLKAYAEAKKIPLFWYEGEVDHVTTRLRKAAEAYDADICLLISGDCPLIDALAIDHIVAAFRKDPSADLIRLLPDESGLSACLQGVSVARKRAWQLADDLSDRPELKEHQFPVMGLMPDRFKAMEIRLPRAYYAPFHRFSIDTWADLEFMNAAYDALVEKNRHFTLPEVVSLVKEAPELAELNRHVHQRRLVEDIHKVLMFADAGGEYGNGHLSRAMELSLQIVERLSWPVTLVVDDESAAEQAKKRGLGVLWGAFGRPMRRPLGSQWPVLTREMADSHQMVGVDISDRRNPKNGWRNAYAKFHGAFVVDHLGPWTKEADLLVCPSVTRPNPHELDPGINTHHIENNGQLLSGKDYIILRREIRREGLRRPCPKNIDLLVYLHAPENRAIWWDACRNLHLNFEIISEYRSDFPRLLSMSKFFVSGFGVSFYEALHLGTIPVCMPDSISHLEDAKTFYTAFDLPSMIIEGPEDFEKIFVNFSSLTLPSNLIQDGTERIVNKINELAAIKKAK
jgi:spore coat polysaccharide biosynthesis protein SpsF